MESKTIHHNGNALYVPESYRLQDATSTRAGDYEEIGTLGLESWGGWISAAYNTKLEWPGVEPLYSRMWRSDPEVTITRTWLQAMSGKLQIEWTLPEQRDGRALEDPTDDDKRALEFAQSLSSDLEGGLTRWMESVMTRVIFYGWGWWEVVPGLRRDGWRPPGDDPWRSEYDDDLVGLRRLAFRDYSSFWGWEMDDFTGRVIGMKQNDPPNDPITVPRDRSLHVTYGDHDNPEGLATLESLWRLERLLYGYEVVHGIGSEHSAGHIKFGISGPLDAETKAVLNRSARALASASEGNFITEMFDKDGNPIFQADLMDVGFTAGDAILNAIKHIRMVKLQLFGMQWAAMATTADTGAYSAVQDASGMALLLLNSLAESNIKQANEQIGSRIFDHPVNRAAFPDMTRRPELAVNEVTKAIDLGSLSEFTQTLGQLILFGRDDEIAIRRESGFLPETPGDEQEDPMGNRVVEPTDEPEEGDEEMPDEGEAEDDAELQRPIVPEPDEQPISVQGLADVSEADITRAVGRFRRWAERNEPDLARLLDSRVVDEDDEA